MKTKSIAPDTWTVLGAYFLLSALLAALAWHFCPWPNLKIGAGLLLLILSGLLAYLIYEALPVLVTIFGLNRRLQVAEKFAHFSLQLHEALSPNSAATAFHLALLAEVLRGQARFAEAEATVRQAADLYKNNVDSQGENTNTRVETEGQIYELLGSVLRDQGKYSEALKAGKKGCELLEEQKQKLETAPAETKRVAKIEAVSHALANSYYELARTLNLTGQPADALTLLHLALDLRGEGTTDRYKASILAELSRSYLMSGEFKEAECAAGKAQANLTSSEQAEEELARARVNLAIADVLRQAPEKSSEERASITPLRTEALRIRKKWLSAKDPELLDIGGG